MNTFAALDFETANQYRSSVCSIGLVFTVFWFKATSPRLSRCRGLCTYRFRTFQVRSQPLFSKSDKLANYFYLYPSSIANNVLSLRPYYHPMQSVIPVEEKEVTYTEFLPCEALGPFIYCYWELKSPPRSTPFCYRVVADGCIDLFLTATPRRWVPLWAIAIRILSFP